METFSTVQNFIHEQETDILSTKGTRKISTQIFVQNKI